MHGWFALRSLMVMAMAALVLGGCAGTGGKRTSYDRDRYEALALEDKLRGEVVLTAMAMLQSPYRYGGTTPGSGFDCSGLVAYVFDAVGGRRLPHNTAMISEISRPVARSALQPGDFVFFNTSGSTYSHMGIYLSDGTFINAPSTGGQVRIDSLRSPYFDRRFVDARSLFQL